MSFNTFVLREAYRRYQKLGDKLTDAKLLIDCKAFTPIIAGLFSNNTPLGGRPNYDGILMLKMLFFCFSFNLMQVMALGKRG